MGEIVSSSVMYFRGKYNRISQNICVFVFDNDDPADPPKNMFSGGCTADFRW